MDIQSLVGKTVRLTIVGSENLDHYIRPKIGTGRDAITFVTLIDSVDDMGLWVHVDDFPVYNSVERKKEEHSALMLLRYDFISSIVHFPELEENASKQHRIGFIVDDQY